MASALAVTGIGFALARQRGTPLLAPNCQWPTKTDIDRPLLAGALTFGVGWGLAGLCPGPALENLASLSPRAIVFVVAMAIGMMVGGLLQRRGTGSEPAERDTVRA